MTSLERPQHCMLRAFETVFPLVRGVELIMDLASGICIVSLASVLDCPHQTALRPVRGPDVWLQLRCSGCWTCSCINGKTERMKEAWNPIGRLISFKHLCIHEDG